MGPVHRDDDTRSDIWLDDIVGALMLDQMTLYPVADDVLFAPGGRVVIRTYGVAAPTESAAGEAGEQRAVAYRTWVTGVRDQPRYWRWGHFEDARRGHRKVLEWLTGRGPQPQQVATA